MGEYGSEQTDIPGVPAAHLLWIVDMDRCEGCLAEGFAAWNALRTDYGLTRRLVVAGDASVPDEAKRALAETKIVAITEEELLAAFGPLLPNTQILVDSSGIILLADSRSTDSMCGWNFVAQVGALRGVLASELVRNSLQRLPAS